MRRPVKSKKFKLAKNIFNTVLILAILIIGYSIISSKLKPVAVKSTPIPTTGSENPRPWKPIESYEVHGIDVSWWQGEIDWETLATADIHFVFMKATEAVTLQDKQFKYNWEQAQKHNLFVGAYHFLNFNSSGVEQAQNFINTVPKTKNMLPPVVDIEFDLLTVLPEDEVANQIIEDTITTIEKHYGVKPILYVNYESYDRYIRGKYLDHHIWICDINQDPNISDKRLWTFWQHSHTGKLPGIGDGKGDVDLNVYYGTYQEFLQEFGLGE